MLLRKYQTQAVAAFWEALSPDVNRVAIEMATGLGKTLVIGKVADEWLSRDMDEDRDRFPPAGRVLVLAERDELVRQAVEKIFLVTRGRWTIGVVKAGQNEVAADIVVASVATLRQPGRKEQIQDVGLIIVDECHHSTAQTYVDILRHYGAMDEKDGCETWPGRIPVLGVTATLARSDGTGLGRIFQDMPFSRGLLWGIRKGYLIDLVPYTIKIPELDLAIAVDSGKGKVLDVALAEGIAPEAVVQAWMENAAKADLETRTWVRYPSTVLFAPLVRSAEAFAEAFNAMDIKAEVVAGAYSDEHNAAVEARFRAGTTTVVCNAMKWTEGLDVPRIGCVIVARPTQSVPLFVQMAGRGVRPWLDAEAPPREDQRCILLCVQGTATEVATVADLSEKIGEVQDGKSVLEMEDEWDIGKGIEDAPALYAGPIRVEAWDALVQQSSKAWKYTKGGAPYLPTAKKRQGYVLIVERDGSWDVFAYGSATYLPPDRKGALRIATAPDLELAMALAEDEAMERGGDIGALLADKARAWRKGAPSEDMRDLADVLGLRREKNKILAQKSSGKAGRLSDLIDREIASAVLDPIVAKIKARASES
jgi:superfamily II DNA or RNA helicase